MSSTEYYDANFAPYLAPFSPYSWESTHSQASSHASSHACSSQGTSYDNSSYENGSYEGGAYASESSTHVMSPADEHSVGTVTEDGESDDNSLDGFIDMIEDLEQPVQDYNGFYSDAASHAHAHAHVASHAHAPVQVSVASDPSHYYNAGASSYGYYGAPAPAPAYGYGYDAPHGAPAALLPPLAPPPLVQAPLARGPLVQPQVVPQSWPQPQLVQVGAAPRKVAAGAGVRVKQEVGLSGGGVKQEAGLSGGGPVPLSGFAPAQESVYGGVRSAIATRFHPKYWRNDRKNLQCFPVCPEFGDYHSVRINNLKHKLSGGGTCGSHVKATLEGAPLEERGGEIVTLSRINIVPPDGARASELQGGMVLSAADFALLKKHALPGQVRRAAPGSFELTFSAKCWKLTVELSKKRRPKNQPDLAPNYCFEVVCAVRLADGSFEVLSSALSSTFHIASTRTLARELEALGIVSTIDEEGGPEDDGDAKPKAPSRKRPAAAATAAAAAFAAQAASNNLSGNNNNNEEDNVQQHTTPYHDEYRIENDGEQLFAGGDMYKRVRHDNPAYRARTTDKDQDGAGAAAPTAAAAALTAAAAAAAEAKAPALLPPDAAQSDKERSKLRAEHETAAATAASTAAAAAATQQQPTSTTQQEPAPVTPPVTQTELQLQLQLQREPVAPLIVEEQFEHAAMFSVQTARFYWLLLGIVGGHHFYLGRNGWGVVYALTLGLFGVGWVFDGLRLPSIVEGVNRQEPVQLTLGETVLSWATLGVLGGHHYALGNLAQAVYYTLTLGGLGVGWLSDAARISDLYAEHCRVVERHQRAAPGELAPPAPLSLHTAYVFWMPGGLIGLHRLYLGDTKMFALYLVTLGLLGFGWARDAYYMADLVNEAQLRRRPAQPAQQTQQAPHTPSNGPEHV
jgi:hypothetical protein